MTTGVKFSQLPVTPVLQGQELFPVLQNNLNRMTTVSALTGAVGAYAVKNTNLINTLSASLLTEIRDNDTLIDSLSTIGIESRALLDTKITELSSWVDTEFVTFEQQVEADIDEIRTEIVTVSAGAGSPVFITSVNNTLGLEQVTYQANTVPADHVVTDVTMDDDSSVQVVMEWDGPAAEWMGDAYINDIAISTNEITQIGNTRRFTATKTIDLQGETEIVGRVNAETYTVNVNTLGGGPEIQSVEFGPPPTVNGYTPDYFLDGDTVEITVTFDTDDVSSVSLYDNSSYATNSITDLNISTTGNPPQATFTAVVNTSVTSITQLPIRISAKNSFGTKGPEFVSVATIPCRYGPEVTNVSYSDIPVINGYQANYFMDGDPVDVVVELDNANISHIKSYNSNNHAIQTRTVSVTTLGSPPSATFTTYIDTDVANITNQSGVFAGRSGHGVDGNTHTSVEQIPVKHGPDITNITIGEPPTTGGYQPSFYLHGDPLDVVVELDSANVVSVGRLASGTYANQSTFVNVTTFGSPPSASFVTSVQENSISLANRSISLNASGPSQRYGPSALHADTIPCKIGPDVLNVTFGSYPGVQTELKDEDTINMTVEYDTNNVATTQIVAGSQYAGKSSSISSVPTNRLATILLTIDTSVTTPTDQLVRLRARGGSTNNSYGSYHNSADALTLNNVRPTFTGWSVTYPGTQTALKQGDVANVTLTVNNAGASPTYTYTSYGSQLSIPDHATYAVTKAAECNSVGAVNESTNNYSLEVHRVENDTFASYSNVVFIADVAPTLTVDSLQNLRSGGSNGTSAQIYSIVARSNQYLSYYDMDATNSAGTVGNWNNSSQNKVWSSQITVDDADTKGTHPWVNITATNRAGIVTSSIATRPDYTLGGFVSRTITIPSLSRTVALGTNVFDVTNLTANETFRGTITFDTTIADGTNLNASLDDGVDVASKFTIVDSSAPTVVDYNGDTFFYLDKTAAANNVSGTSQLVIEETL